jgi:hypothetical protein
VTVIEGLLMSGAWLKQKFNSLEAQSTAATLDPPLTRRNEGCAGRRFECPFLEGLLNE